ncbi:hypothetical protein FA15DRAFT_668895 [Coprinopsis marcescibilis]|uniref:PHD-type domain-containing protein n=1 Tax=Coprinopsis marcescibilis TaxID=230819 RepID=A0A5C3KX34_COPMA|nr:hypothetical protein FA15DRAFT_668895 [Coprinopsis marcescibilis]
MATTAALPPYMLPGVSVHQPAHLEGDPTLATEILPGPPSLVSVQQSAQKRDPKKPSTMYSYLPPSDPGSTYSGVMHGTLIGLEEPRSKRPRADKGASGRAQRASARNQNAMVGAVDPSSSLDNSSASGQQPIVVDAEPSGSGAVDDDLALSRSNSSLNLQDPAPQTSTAKTLKRDKGKGKDVGTPPIRVKEEPKNVMLNTPEPNANMLNNNDHCSSCQSTGALVYCDGCPRAFHLWCLDPPMESIDEGDSRWFCPACIIRKHPPRKPPRSLMSPLIHHLQTTIPIEYQLPDDIKNFFRDVGSGPRGAYVDLTEAKPPRLNRHGQLEERDPNRLKDRNGAPVLCYKCGKSALPQGLASAVPTTKRPRRATSKAATPEAFKGMVSCDFCSLHWHLDCIDPPLPAMPPFYKKWMCPNHAERLMPTKMRIPKQNAPPIEITKPKQFNNGHIDVIHPEVATVASTRPRVHVDEVLINGRRYRVPEKIIILDFWNKVSKHGLSENKDVDLASGLSSPLTELSSLDERDDHTSGNSSPALMEEFQAAQALFGLSNCKRSTSSGKSKVGRSSTSTASSSQQSFLPAPVATASTSSTSTRPVRGAKKAATLKISSVINADMNGTGASTPSSSVPREPGPTLTIPVASGRRTKRSTAAVQPKASGRELRSRSRNNTQESFSSLTTDKTTRTNQDVTPPDTMAAPVQPAEKFRTVNIKVEEVDHGFSLVNGFETSSISTAGSQKTPSSRKRKLPPNQDLNEPSKTEPKGKKARKRKSKDDELPGTKTGEGKKTRKGNEASGSRDKRKDPSTPSKATPSAVIDLRTPGSVSRVPPLTPTTLKIRLPRLNSTSKNPASTFTNGSADTPTRL